MLGKILYLYILSKKKVKKYCQILEYVTLLFSYRASYLKVNIDYRMPGRGLSSIGRAADSKSVGCVFKSRRPQFFFFLFNKSKQ